MDMTIEEAWRLVCDAVNDKVDTYKRLTPEDNNPTKEQFALGWAMGLLSEAVVEFKKVD